MIISVKQTVLKGGFLKLSIHESMKDMFIIYLSKS